MRSVPQIFGGARAVTVKVSAHAIDEKQREANVHAALRKRRARFGMLQKRFKFAENIVDLGCNA